MARTKGTGRTRPDLALRNKQNAIHGMTDSREFSAWRSMHHRCGNPSSKDYPRYGGRGIVVCPRWAEFINFYADMGPRPAGTTVDRIDNTGNYTPENCRWATPKEQARNRRNSHMIEWRGETKCIAQWAEDLGIERKALEMRLRAQSVDVAFTTPYIPRRKEAA